jgi:hypothetical protein
MAENVRCNWCNNFGASTWTRTIDKKKFTSRQKFCSLRCKTEFEDRREVDWIPEKGKKGSQVLMLVTFIYILYMLSKS